MSTLSRAQEKLVRSLNQKKHRRETGFCLIEGEKLVGELKGQIEFTFSREDTELFDDLVTTQTPQNIAAVAHIPSWSSDQVFASGTVLLLDGVQDPGNVGGMFRLAMGFGATMVLIESADPSSSKVIRSSAGAMFHVPWIEVAREDADGLLGQQSHLLFRLEKREGAQSIEKLRSDEKIALIIGSEGKGIQLDIDAPSVAISHADSLESLNVGHATAIALYERNR